MAVEKNRRLVFEHGVVFGDARLVMAPRFWKSYGRKLGKFSHVEPLQEGDPNPGAYAREVYTYFDSAPRRKNYRRRMVIKQALKGCWIGSVAAAMRSSKTAFSATVAQAERGDSPYATASKYVPRWRKKIRELGFDGLDHFWRGVRGTQPLPIKLRMKLGRKAKKKRSGHGT